MLIILGGHDEHLASLTPGVLICETGLINLCRDTERFLFINCFVNTKAVGTSAL